MTAAGLATGTAVASAAASFCEAAENPLELVQISGDIWEWRPCKEPPKACQLPTGQAYKHSNPEPLVTNPVTVVDSPGITINEYFGQVASGDGTASFAMATVHRADESSFQAPRFAEYVMVTSGTLVLQTVHEDGASLTKTQVKTGEGVYLPAGLRVKWTWPEPCTYTVVCVPAFSPHTAGNDSRDSMDSVVDKESRAALAKMHLSASPTAARHPPSMVVNELGKGITPLKVKPVAVVDAPGITITECFGNVASNDPVASLGRAVVKHASQEAWQAPAFDEYVICTKGSIDFLYGDGRSKKVVAGQGVFLPMHLRVKWVWPEATEYSVLCLPAFTPELCGREAEENATNAKDSASMAKLEELHKARQSQRKTTTS